MSLPDKLLNKILSGCAKNDRLAQEKLYKAYYQQMLSICYRYLNDIDLAHDALNTGFLKAFQNIQTFNNSKGNFNSWLSTIIIRNAIDIRRSEIKFNICPDLLNEEEQVFILPEVLANLFSEDIFKKLQQLPKASSLVFNMYVIDGYSHKEISEKLNITESTSRWHLSEAKAKLRSMLLKDDEYLINNDQKQKMR